MGDNDSLYKDDVKSAGCQCHCEGRVRCKWFSAGPMAMVRSSDEDKVNNWRTVVTMIKMNWIWPNIPRALLATTPSNGDRLPQESLQLLKAHCLPLGGPWRGLLKLKVSLMQLTITDNYALNSTILGLIIYWVRDDKWKKKMMDHDRQATHRREFWLKVHCYSHQALRRRWMCLNRQFSSQFPLPLFLFPLLHFFTLTKYFNVCAIMRTNCSVTQ